MEFNKKVFEIIDSVENLDNGFEDILELSRSCKFSDCTHTNETDCAVKRAISHGTLPEESFNNYDRDKKEAEYVSKHKNKTKAIDYMKQRKLFKRS
jgi:putative ribosome biogenesis GTPase RsgA